MASDLYQGVTKGFERKAWSLGLAAVALILAWPSQPLDSRYAAHMCNIALTNQLGPAGTFLQAHQGHALAGAFLHQWLAEGAERVSLGASLPA